MKINIYTSDQFLPNTWSGGTTTELFIYPRTAGYKKGNYDFRLSTATVEVGHSVFTPLEGVSRTLMVLDGKMKLIHQDQHQSNLGKFDIDRFQGGWNTTSFGRCIDFNLMTKGNVKGDQKGLSVDARQIKNLHINSGFSWIFLFVHKGSVMAKVQGKQNELQAQNLLVIKAPIECDIEIEGIVKSELVICHISL